VSLELGVLSIHLSRLSILKAWGLVALETPFSIGKVLNLVLSPFALGSHKQKQNKHKAIVYTQ
jgi:hypothetical protein